MNKRTSAAAALAILALATAGACSSTTKQSIAPPPSTTATATDQVTPSDILPPPGSTPTTDTPSPTATTYPIGYHFVYTDGTGVTVTSMSRFTPSDTSTGVGAGQVGVVVTITVQNNTGGNFELATVLCQMYTGASGNQAETVFDSAQGIDGFSGSIPPGHSATGKFAFAVNQTDLGQLLVTVQPGFNYDPASFEGSLH